jgi:hypothetical protein
MARQRIAAEFMDNRLGELIQNSVWERRHCVIC